MNIKNIFLFLIFKTTIYSSFFEQTFCDHNPHYAVLYCHGRCRVLRYSREEFLPFDLIQGLINQYFDKLGISYESRLQKRRVFLFRKDSSEDLENFTLNFVVIRVSKTNKSSLQNIFGNIDEMFR